MSDSDDILKKLQAAQGDPAAQTLAVVDFACGKNQALRRAVEAAAIPHWFDADILRSILDKPDQPKAANLYNRLKRLSFIEAFEERDGYNVHEATRLALRKKLADFDRARFIELSQRASRYFGRLVLEKLKANSDDRAVTNIEYFFHLLVADPIQGGRRASGTWKQWADQGLTQQNLSFASQLDELIEQELLVEPARASVNYVRGRARHDYGDLGFVSQCALEALQGYESSKDLWGQRLSHELLGSVRFERGDLVGAEESFQSALGIDSSLASAESGNAPAQRNLSVSWIKLGDVQVARGELDTAEESYGKALEIAQRLAQQDPSNSLWQRDLSVSWEKLGSVQVARGELDTAEESYGKTLEIAQRLAQQDPSNSQWQRDLSVSWGNLGNVQVARGVLDAVEESYGKALEIAQRLAQQDPSNSQWQRDLSVSWNNLGDVQVARGELDTAEESYGKALEIRKRLAQQDPSNSQWQRDLSVSWINLGDLQTRRGEHAAAEQSHRNALEIARELVALDSTNPGFLICESTGAERLGAALAELGQLEEAEPHFKRSVAIAQQLAEADPDRGSAHTWTNLADSLGRMAKFRVKQSRSEDARNALQHALKIYHELKSEGRLTAKQLEDMEALDAEYRELAD